MKRRILLVGEAVTLAHVARPLVFAKQLKFQYEIKIACDVSAHKWIIAEGWQPLIIHSLSSKEFLRRLKWGECVFRESELRMNVEEDLSLLDEIKPDVVIGDFRLSLSISCRLAKIPYVNLGNAYWHGLDNVVRLPVPELPITHVLGVGASQWLFDRVAPFIMKRHGARFNKIRNYFGLSSLVEGLGNVYLDGDVAALVDLKECYPEVLENDVVKFVGPGLWSPSITLPVWWSESGWSGRTVFICLGSSGQINVTKIVVNAFLELKWTVLLSTAGRFAPENIQLNVDRLFIADFLPAEEVIKRVDLLVCNGGSPMCQLAMAYGVSVIGVPSNLDQFLNMSMMKRHGIGYEIRPENLDIEGVINVVNVMHNDNYKDKKNMFFAEKSKMSLESNHMLDLIKNTLGDY